jgi:hypothetical protein
MFKNVFSYRGRIRRAEFVLTLIGAYFSIFVVSAFLSVISYFFPLFIFFYTLFVFFVIILQAAKRCHDMNVTAWLALVPIFNPLVLLFAEGTYGDNNYGKDPRIGRNPFDATQTPKFTATEPIDWGQPKTQQQPQTIYTKTTATSSQYVVSPDGKTLIKWLDTETTAIDMPADPVLSNVTTLAKDLFYDCNKLTKIVFPENLERIDRYAFDGCEALRDFSFPKNLNYIGEYVFGKNCPMKLVFKSSTPPVLEGDFGYNDERLQVIYVPLECAENYRQDPSWKKYAHLIF